MALRFGITLFAAMLLCAHTLFAEDAPPVPDASPPRVPFSAFRMKPILDPHLADENERKTVPASQPIEQTPETPVKAEIKAEKPAISVKPLPKPVLDAVAESRQEKQADEPQDDAPTPIRTVAGAPVPLAKPRLLMSGAQAPTIHERIMALPSGDGASTPRPPAVAAQDIPDPNAAYVPPSKPQRVVLGNPGGTVRIRDAERDRDRFSSKQRTAGAGFGIAPVRIRPMGTPGSAGAQALKQAKGVSPVLLPGNTMTVSAPDWEDFDRRGVPNEVIVFFQENSVQLEVGQLDILQNDVLRIMLERPELELEIVGYAEPQQGSAVMTANMAQSRAHSIRDYLVGKRIDPDRLTLKAKGDDTEIEPRDRVDMFFSR